MVSVPAVVVATLRSLERAPMRACTRTSRLGLGLAYHPRMRSPSTRSRLVPLGALVLLLATATAACESLAERSKYLTSASAFEWSGGEFTVAGEDDMWGQVTVYDGTLKFYAKGFPPGTRFSIAAATATVGEDGRAELETPALVLYGTLPFGTVERPTIEGATMTVEAPGATALEVPVPPIGVSFPGTVLLKAAEGPVTFAGDEPGDAKIDNIVFDATAQEPTVIGETPKTFGDVDAVAIITLEPTGKITECTGYTDNQGNALPTVQLELAHSTVAVHARRTGEKLASKRFDPVQTCPESFMKWSNESETELRPYIPLGEIETWLESVVAQH